MKVLYYDCFCGISGDMNAAALIDLGVSEQYIRTELGRLGIASEFTLNIEKGLKNGISGTRFEVMLSDRSEHHHHEHHGERNFNDIRNIIESSGISDYAKQLSITMFRLIAEAEGKVHGKPWDEIHFHEVGAVDSIVDIVTAAICIDYLKPDRILSSPVQLGGGFAVCSHGSMPVPAPATAEILKNIPIRLGLVPFEACTPTGAAILKAVVNDFIDQPDLAIKSIGYGLGHKDASVPNVLRVFMSEDSSMQKDTQWLLETNIDDMSPEMLGYVEERLLDVGALDVFRTPIVMKKGRAAVKLSVLANSRTEAAVLDVIFRESSSIGLRKYEVGKIMLSREFIEVDTVYGRVSVKKSYYKGELVRSKPEYEDCRRLAKEHGVTLGQIYKEVNNELAKNCD